MALVASLLAAGRRLAIAVPALTAAALAAQAAPSVDAGLEADAATVQPFFETYCVSCHGGASPEAELDLRDASSLSTAVEGFDRLTLVLEKLASHEMPPEDADVQPPAEERAHVIAWLEAARRREAEAHAGDPGVVLARRLSNAEYNYTIRDLAGVDIQPTREFPIDPANPAGFDNSGESLVMSPTLLEKYLQAAREVADHLVLKPDGIAFAPYSMLVETDRDRYCVEQIMAFYARHNTNYADYFAAAWQYKHRSALGQPDATLADIAAERGVSAKYLATVWSLLEVAPEDVGPIAKLRAMWSELPAPVEGQPAVAAVGCEQMRDFVVELRAKLEPRFRNLEAGDVDASSQPLLMWKNRQYATHRMTFERQALQVDGEIADDDKDSADEPGADDEFGPGRTRPVDNDPGDPDLMVPADQRAEYEAAFARFCAVFPDAFIVSERGRNYFDKSKDRGRYLSAGFHNLMGYFRDDQPLYELVLDESQQQELDALWQELDYVALATHRTFVQFFLDEAGEARRAILRELGRELPPAGDQITSEPMIRMVADNYVERARDGGNETAVRAIEEHFRIVSETLRWVERAQREAEPKHLDALLEFASRAYRRRLAGDEQEGLLAYYRWLREETGLNHEEAMRDSLISVLMAPDFCYRIDLVDAGAEIRPLSDDALASRLSYFLWSSMPDEELLNLAAAGKLRRPETLAAQARRMLSDPRAWGLATEFGGHWLDFRQFEDHNAVDHERFGSFTDDLRQAMFEEPIRFLVDAIQADRSVLELLDATHTFVNPVLARHYGMPQPELSPDGAADVWVRVDDADRYGRGGLLPMAVFLTKNAPGLRTSPVKRGYWVVKNVLGERIPPPPAVVPELPRDEADLGELTLPEALARHRADPSCAACHQRFDSLGLVFEGFGPVGERRTEDLGGRPVADGAVFPDGSEGAGVSGLRDYIRRERQDDFLDNLCRKLLSYALGRSLILSDEATVAAMRSNLAANDYRWSALVETIVASPQFLTKRGPVELALRGE